jgi:hypothetical protein
VPRISTRGRAFFLKKQISSPSVALGEEGFFLKIKKFFPECCTRGRGIFFKKNLPRVLHSGKRIFKKKQTTRTALNLPRVLGRHSGKASPSVRFLALGEGIFPVRGIPGGSSPSVALGEGFPECFSIFPEWMHSGKPPAPVVLRGRVDVFWVLRFWLFLTVNNRWAYWPRECIC